MPRQPRHHSQQQSWQHESQQSWQQDAGAASHDHQHASHHASQEMLPSDNFGQHEVSVSFDPLSGGSSLWSTASQHRHGGQYTAEAGRAYEGIPYTLGEDQLRAREMRERRANQKKGAGGASTLSMQGAQGSASVVHSMQLNSTMSSHQQSFQTEVRGVRVGSGSAASGEEAENHADTFVQVRTSAGTKGETKTTGAAETAAC